MSNGYDTVAGHVKAGRVTGRQRAELDDLEFAQDWLLAYESTVDDANTEAAATVVVFLQREINRRKARKQTRRS